MIESCILCPNQVINHYCQSCKLTYPTTGGSSYYYKLIVYKGKEYNAYWILNTSFALWFEQDPIVILKYPYTITPYNIEKKFPIILTFS